jgi:hypothetical protein
MTGWLSRGLIATAVGAVLAFAVTVHVAHVDIANAGAIIMFAGIGYLLVHLALLGYERGWGSSPAPQRFDRAREERYRDDRYEPYAGRDQYARDPYADRSPRTDRGYAAQPRPARVDYRRADDGYADDPDDTRVMPIVRDARDEDTTVLPRRDRRPPS